MSSIETLGEAFNNGWRLTARCNRGKVDHGHAARECLWRYELDMTTLVATRGRDFPLVQLSERLRCPRCGNRRIAVIFHSPSTNTRKSASG